MAKKLVAYFTASGGGVTRRAAEALAAAAGADLAEIAPVEAYTAADLDWRDEHSRSSLEHKDAASRPAIRQAANTDGYDTIFLGFPIWWYTAPQIIRTYLESGDFAGKTVVPFATSGGSGLGGTVEDLRPSAPAANWKPGRKASAGESHRRFFWRSRKIPQMRCAMRAKICYNKREL